MQSITSAENWPSIEEVKSTRRNENRFVYSHGN